MLNSKTQRALKPQTLTADTTVYNDATATTCRGLHVFGKPTVVVSVGTLGVSCMGISVAALALTDYGVTPTAISMRGADSVLLPVQEALHRLVVDRPLTETETLVISAMPKSDTAVVAINVVSEAQVGGSSDAPY